MSQVVIDGSGVAACCCAKLLRMSGSTVSVDPQFRNAGPVLMLSEQTQKLLADIFHTKSLFPGAIQIRQRVVLWGKDAEVAVLPHSGLVMDESALLRAMWGLLSPASAAASPDWRIASSQASPQSQLHAFGKRIAITSRIRFKSNAPQDACWMESLETGWLFLLPSGNGAGSLISVGGEPATLVAQSRLISEQVETIEDAGKRFAAYPRINTPLCGEGWIACGTAALGFDPICGEGAGNAAREAILASAIVSGVAKGLSVEELLTLYQSRLIHGFLRHLALCLDFYRSACQSDWWQSEISYLEEGITWARQQLNEVKQQKYCLAGFELQPI